MKMDFGLTPIFIFIKWYQSRERISCEKGKSANRRRRGTVLKTGEFMVLLLCRERQLKVRRFAAT